MKNDENTTDNQNKDQEIKENTENEKENGGKDPDVEEEK